MENDVLTKQNYNPNRLLDCLLQDLRLKNDAALSRMLEIGAPVISKIRHNQLPVSAAVLVRMHEISNISIRDLRFLLGDRRNKYRVSRVHGRRRRKATTAII